MANPFYTIAIIILVIAILVLCVLIYEYKELYDVCMVEQSPYCYSLACPGNINPEDVCFGYAQRKDKDGNVQCANSGVLIYKNKK